MSERGVLVTFEGGEGCGKSTQIKLLAKRLEAAGLTVRLMREPGGTEVGEAIRAILLDPENGGLDPRAELLLYEAARAQIVAELIEPALEAGEVVLLDRFYDSTTAYQGHARALPLDEVARLNSFATAGLEPDRTVLLDIPADEGLRRATAETTDRLEGEDLAFHERVRSGFLALAAENPGRVVVVDATGSVDEVSDRVAASLRGLRLLGRALESS